MLGPPAAMPYLHLLPGQLLLTTQLRRCHPSIAFVGPLQDSETSHNQVRHCTPHPVQWPPSAGLVSPVPGGLRTPSTVLGQEMCLLDGDGELGS